MAGAGSRVLSWLARYSRKPRGPWYRDNSREVASGFGLGVALTSWGARDIAGSGDPLSALVELGKIVIGLLLLAATLLFLRRPVTRDDPS